MSDHVEAILAKRPKPRVTEGIEWGGPIWDYADELEALVRRLAEALRDISTHNIDDLREWDEDNAADMVVIARATLASLEVAPAVAETPELRDCEVKFPIHDPGARGMAAPNRCTKTEGHEGPHVCACGFEMPETPEEAARDRA